MVQHINLALPTA